MNRNCLCPGLADPVPASQNSTPAKISTGPSTCTQSQAGDGGQERFNAAMPFCWEQPWVCFHCMSPVLICSRISLQSNQDLKSRVSPLASTSWAPCWPFPLKLPDFEILFWATQDSSLSMAGFFFAWGRRCSSAESGTRSPSDNVAVPFALYLLDVFFLFLLLAFQFHHAQHRKGSPGILLGESRR